MEIKKNRKYNSSFRKKLLTKLEYFQNKNDLIDIYNIIFVDIGNNISSNINGIFINLNILSDKCIDNLLIKLNKNII